MSARCLRCGAGNEWIEGQVTLTATPKEPAPVAQADAATEIKTMVDEAASAIVKDAERYRWLRDGRGCEEIWGADLALEKLDAAIDAARAGKQERTK